MFKIYADILLTWNRCHVCHSLGLGLGRFDCRCWDDMVMEGSIRFRRKVDIAGSIWFLVQMTSQRVHCYLVINWLCFINDLHCFYTLAGYYYSRVGLKGSDFPPLMLNGYTRSLPSMPSRDIFENPWPKSDAWVPPVRRDHGTYYGYYHDRIEKERERRKRELPFSQKIEPLHVVSHKYNLRWGFNQPWTREQINFYHTLLSPWCTSKFLMSQHQCYTVKCNCKIKLLFHKIICLHSGCSIA